MRSVLHRPTVLALVALAAIVVASAPWRGLFEPDESRYAEVAREMLADGHWLVPHLNGAVYAHKPPLFLWLIAFFRWLGLPWTLAAVLPSALALAGLVLLLPVVAGSLGLRPATGELGAILLVGMPLVGMMGAAARMDMLLVLLNTVALLALARLVGAGSLPRSAPAANLLLWTAIALGVLTKGPVALALPGATLLVYWAAAPGRTPLREVWRGWGPLLALALVLLWLVPAGVVGGRAYIEEITIRQSAGRIVGSFAHGEPFYFHLVSYPLTGLPASPLALLGVFHAVRGRRQGGRLLLAASLVAVLAFFSLVSGKLVIYLLPLFPVAALLAADTLAEERRGSRAAASLGGAGLVLLGVAVTVAPQVRAQLLASRSLLVGVGVGVVAAGIAALVAGARAASARAGGRALALAALFASFALVPAGTAALAPVMTVRDVGAAVRGVEPMATDVVAYRDYWAGLSLYAERNVRVIEDPAALAAYLAGGRTAVIREQDWRSLFTSLAPVVARAERIPYRSSGLWVVVGRQPRPAA